MQPLFTGANSLRERSENRAFWLTGLLAFPAALAIGYALHESIGASQVALFVVIAMIYVTLARGRLLGSSVRIHETQYARLFAIVRSACAALDIPVPLVFVREDNVVPAVALGLVEPYALVLSSHWAELFADDELKFVIGRELGHIAAGHTRYHSLLSASGNENPVVALIFGAWLRRCALTCDKVGLLCAGSFDAAVRAIGVAAFHAFGRRIDYGAFARQQSEVAADPVLRWGEWLGSEPYATRRIAALSRFIETPAYAAAQRWIARQRSDEPPSFALPVGTRVSAHGCAGWWRRFTALLVDAIVIVAILTALGGGLVTAAAAAPSHSAPVATLGPVSFYADNSVEVRLGGSDVLLSLKRFGLDLWFPVYLAVLVALAGQTFGMMVAGLRVVTTDFHRPGTGRTIWRYAIVMVLWWLIAPLSLIWRHVLLHDRWSATRVVKVERLIARRSGDVR